MMSRVTGKQHKVLNSIIVRYAIDMVNNLRWSEMSAERGFHHKTMLSDIATRILVWVRSIKNIDIAIFLFTLAALPMRAFRSVVCFCHSLCITVMTTIFSKALTAILNCKVGLAGNANKSYITRPLFVFTPLWSSHSLSITQIGI